MFTVQAEFSTLKVAACIPCNYIAFETKPPILMLKTRPKQLLYSLLLDIALPKYVCSGNPFSITLNLGLRLEPLQIGIYKYSQLNHSLKY